MTVHTQYYKQSILRSPSRSSRHVLNAFSLLRSIKNRSKLYTVQLPILRTRLLRSRTSTTVKTRECDRRRVHANRVVVDQLATRRLEGLHLQRGLRITELKSHRGSCSATPTCPSSSPVFVKWYVERFNPTKKAAVREGEVNIEMGSHISATGGRDEKSSDVLLRRGCVSPQKNS